MSGFVERGHDIRAALLEQMDEEPLAEFASVICNGCGVHLIAPTVEELAVVAEQLGWKLGTELGADDFCSGCR